MITFFVISLIIIILNLKIKIKIQAYLNNLDFNYILSTKLFGKEIIINKISNTLLKKANKNSRKVNINKLAEHRKFFKIEKIDINTKLGLIDIFPTIYGIPLISTFYAFLFNYLKISFDENHRFNVRAVYNKLEISSKLSCILSIKIAHIIYIIILLKCERSKKYGQSSNRRTNEYCYE